MFQASAGAAFLMEDHRTDRRRAGEGSMVALRNGDLLFVYGVFDGGGDASPARLVQRRSSDGGRTWTESVPFLDLPEGTCNLMSVSLARLADGRIGCVYIHKLTPYADDILFIASADEGRTWSEPVSASGRDGLYYVVNNDRLIQLSNGRLLAPYAWHPITEGRHDGHGQCGCFLSDDGGRTWRKGRDRLGVKTEHLRPPVLGGGAAPGRFDEIRAAGAVVQEPGVVELAGGVVLMWARSNAGCAFAARSEDGGDTWSDFIPLSDFSMPCGPQAIYRLPGSKRLVMFYNDRAGVPFGDPEFQWRTPLAVAVSDDEAATWRRLPDLEDNTRNYCYLSACFHQGNAVLSYYESAEEPDADGRLQRRNLRSLKVRIVPLATFLS
jgi:hypothetical protein